MESQLAPDPSPASEHATTVAEDLPELYRTILDRVADLERLGSRVEAGRIRTSATRAYSRAWDASARRELLSLLHRADRQLVGPSTRGWSLRRRSAAAR
ncbi:MAG: hypothetical protein H0U52_15640 [Chloroflexi bacterium]|nr:hypothetical protein [Chloroflexota bacterium]